MPVNSGEAKIFIKKPTIHDTEVKRVENKSEDPLRSSKPSPFMDSILEDRGGDVPFGRKITFSKMAKSNRAIENHSKVQSLYDYQRIQSTA